MPRSLSAQSVAARPVAHRPGRPVRVEHGILANRYAFDAEDLRGAVTMSPVGVKAALRRLEDRGRIVRPSARRGFFVIVPPEYSTLGGAPSAWWLDAFTRQCPRQYA